MKRKYHYEWIVSTDNLCWGRIVISKARNSTDAERIAKESNKGCYIIRKERIYN